MLRTKISLIIVAFLAMFAFTLSPIDVYAQANQIRCGINAASGVNGCGQPAGQDPTKALNSTVTNVINILSAIVGVLAVIMIIIAGFRFITSGGSSEQVGSAKKTIIYAVIGLFVVALAQVITQYVISQASCPNGRVASGAHKGECKP